LPSDDSTRRGLLKLLPPSTAQEVGSPDDETKDTPLMLAGVLSNLPADLSLAERFVDDGELARGGMGVVHRVLERSLNRVVALKVLKADKMRDANARRRFVAEAQITGQLEHPYIVPVYELGIDDADQLFFTMKLVEGDTLMRLVEDDEPETNDDALMRALDALGKVADALSYAHSRGVIHRDIKPSNIMLGAHGQVYLMDWGIARVPSAPAEPLPIHPADRRTTSITMFAVESVGTVLGTYAYLSPEQARGDIDAMDARTDVFGLGAVLFRIVSGQAPIQGTDQLDALSRAGSGRFVDVRDRVHGRLRRALLDVALQAMQSLPEQRFSNVLAFKRALESVLSGGLRFPLQRFAAGSIIVGEGSNGTDAYIVHAGVCEVFCTVQRGAVTEQLVLQRLEAGGVFGETAIFTKQPRNASVRALTDAELWVVPGAVLEDELGLNGWLGAFVRSLGSRITDSNHKVSQLEMTARRERILATTWRLVATTSTVPLDVIAEASRADEASVRALLSEDTELVLTQHKNGAWDVSRRR
jgi:serine/threonine-protein kinase